MRAPGVPRAAHGPQQKPPGDLPTGFNMNDFQVSVKSGPKGGVFHNHRFSVSGKAGGGIDHPPGMTAENRGAFRGGQINALMGAVPPGGVSLTETIPLQRPGKRGGAVRIKREQAGEKTTPADKTPTKNIP